MAIIGHPLPSAEYSTGAEYSVSFDNYMRHKNKLNIAPLLISTHSTANRSMAQEATPAPVQVRLAYTMHFI